MKIPRRQWIEWLADVDTEGAEYGGSTDGTLDIYEDGCFMHDCFGGGYSDDDSDGDRELRGCVDCPDCELSKLMREYVKEKYEKPRIEAKEKKKLSQTKPKLEPPFLGPCGEMVKWTIEGGGNWPDKNDNRNFRMQCGWQLTVEIERDGAQVEEELYCFTPDKKSPSGWKVKDSQTEFEPFYHIGKDGTILGHRCHIKLACK